MEENDSEILGLYDELTSFLTGINLYNLKGLSESYCIHKFYSIMVSNGRVGQVRS